MRSGSCGDSPRHGLLRRATCVAALLWLAAAPRAAAAPDPLLSLVGNLNRYFHDNEADGVVVDYRWVLNEPEAVRLSVISQLLGYNELYAACPRPSFRTDIMQRAHYLIPRMPEIAPGGPFDGMLGYALLGAYEATGDTACLAAGQVIVDQLSTIPEYQLILNGGLMAAMAFAKHHQLTGDAESARKTRVVIASVPQFQNADGSFPHWCWGSRDIHYTGWMAMEMILIGRILPDPAFDAMLPRMLAFLEERVDDLGWPAYEGPCANGDPDCREYYDSVRTGCDIDYDTRAFTNELGYHALLFDHFSSPEYGAVMRFLSSLEFRGTIADKWDFVPPPADPYYPWTIADTSVVNMSVLFWSLAAIVHGRGYTARELEWMLDHDDPGRRDLPEDGPATGAPDPGPVAVVAGPRVRPPWAVADSLFLAGLAATGSPPAATGGDPPPRGATRGPGARLSLIGVAPNPSHGACEVRFTMPAPARVQVAVYDAAGRRVRRLEPGPLAAGAHAVRWDQRDDRGRPVPRGLYFLRVRAAAETATARVFAAR